MEFHIWHFITFSFWSFLKDKMIVESETYSDSNNDDFSAIGICVSSKCRNLENNHLMSHQVNHYQTVII